VIWIPTRAPGYREAPVASASDRVAMLRMALESEQGRVAEVQAQGDLRREVQGRGLAVRFTLRAKEEAGDAVGPRMSA